MDSCYQLLREVPSPPVWSRWGKKSQKVFQGFICCTASISPLRTEDEAQPALSTSADTSSDISLYFFCGVGFCVVFDHIQEPQISSSSLVIPHLILDVTLQWLNQSNHQGRPRDMASPWNHYQTRSEGLMSRFIIISCLFRRIKRAWVVLFFPQIILIWSSDWRAQRRKLHWHWHWHWSMTQ